MTPKEKAEQLLDRFDQEIYSMDCSPHSREWAKDHVMVFLDLLLEEPDTTNFWAQVKEELINIE